MNQDHAKLKKKVIDSVIQLRGTVLDGMVDIERQIDDFISNYFCKSEIVSNELKEILLHTERITLGSKKDMLFILLNRYHKDFLKRNPKFIDKLDKLIPHRNIFAHLEADTSDEAIKNMDNEIVFKKFKNGKIDLRKYGVEEVNQITIDFKYVNISLYELLLNQSSPI